MVRAAKRQFSPIGPEERRSLFKGWVLSILRIHNTIAPVFDDIAYWSPANSQVEIDFVLRRESKILALDAKSMKRYDT